MIKTALAFDELTKLATGDVTDVACPVCGPGCKTEINRRRKVLRIWDSGTLITYKCARCELSGWARDGSGKTRPPRERPVETEPKKDKAAIAAFLWSRSLPLRGSLAEVYLHQRRCWFDSPNLRFLPARGQHHAAMIARFGHEDTVASVHLTKLQPDGTAKAGTENDKIIVGPSVGDAIIINENLERGELFIAEGIEDTATVAAVTGWSAYAAGSAARIPHLVAATSKRSRIYVAVDADKSGRQALKKAQAIRPDLVPVHFAKILAYREGVDANAARVKFGDEVVLAALEWADVRARYVAKEIGFEQMQRMTEHARAIFAEVSEEP